MSYGAYSYFGQQPPQGGYYNQPPPPGPPPPQGGGYGYQQPNPYGPPPGQPPYGGHSPAPPQQGQYPPYGQQQQQPPPPQGYGAPPPMPPRPTSTYGSGPPPPAPGSAQAYFQQPPPGPPPGQYGAPPAPYGGAQGYGAAPPASYPTPPSPGYGAPQIVQWDPNPTAQAVHKALKKFNVDENTIISQIATLNPLQVQVLNLAYQRNFHMDLAKHLADKNSSWFANGLSAIARGPLQQDVHRLHEAMAGLGTKESILNEVLLSRSNADINAIKAEYKRTYHRDLVAAVKDELSLKTERHFEVVLSATRAEDSAPVVKSDIDRDVDTIYRATEGKIGHDSMAVCSIFSLRNDNQLRAIAHEYERKYAARLENVIRKEFSGHMEDALLYQLQHGMDRYMLQARLLEDSMAGLGTKDHQLVNRVVKCHWDPDNLANVKGAYETRYKKSLGSRIRGETSGDYRRLMLACIREAWQ